MEQSLKLGDLSISFQRTCRVPRAKGMVNDLPASLGTFPVFKVSDYSSKVPGHWKPAGHFIPMFPQEAMWMNFGRSSAPVALMIGAGMINAITGKKLEPLMSKDPQNYLVVPPQPWLDGFKRDENGSVFQFVAAELGKGETVEEQLTGKAEFGGIQIGMHTPKIKLVNATRPRESVIGGYPESFGWGSKSPVRMMSLQSHGPRDIGLGVGGAIKQKIYPDPYLQGRAVNEVWNEVPIEKAYIYIVHSADFKSITGQEPPATPITHEFYQKKGYPWFGLPDGSWGDVEGGGQAIEDLKPVPGGSDGVNVPDAQPNPATADLWP